MRGKSTLLWATLMGLSVYSAIPAAAQTALPLCENAQKSLSLSPLVYCNTAIDSSEYSILFIQRFKEILGDVNPDAEIQNRLADLGLTLVAFLNSLDGATSTAELRDDDSMATIFKHPNSRLAREAFLLADIPTKTRILETFSSSSNALSSITQNIAYLGKSREEIEATYGAGFMQIIEKRGNRLKTPDPNDDTITLSPEDYVANLSSALEERGLYSVYLKYLLDQSERNFLPKVTEPQFYALLDLARSSYEEGKWDEKDDDRRHMGKTQIAMKALFTQDYEEFHRRMGDFFKAIGYKEAAQVHAEIAAAYQTHLEAERVTAEAERVTAEAERVTAEKLQWERTLELLGL